MLEKPDLQDKQLIACLQDAYGIQIDSVTFLPLGADINTALYRAVTGDGTAFFVKLRRGAFDEATVAVPRWLSDQGISAIIPPLVAKSGRLWALLDPFTVTLYPFITGHSGYEVALSDQHWRAFGDSLKRMHTTVFPAELLQDLPQETYSSQYRQQVKMFLGQIKHSAYHDPVAQQAATFLRGKNAETLSLVERAEEYAQILRRREAAFTVCHADLHAGNIFISTDDHFYIVDWDTLILAPKERDLMFIGGGQGFSGHTSQEEITLFYQGYDDTLVNPMALAYYRYERIIQDIAAFCDQLLLTSEGGEDRPQALLYLMSNFLPSGTIETAYAADMKHSLLEYDDYRKEIVMGCDLYPN